MRKRENTGARRFFFSHSPGAWCAAVGLLLGALLTVCLAPYLFWEDPPTGRVPLSGKRVLALGGIFLASEFLAFFRVGLSDRVRRGLSYVFLFLTPFFTFMAVDLINNTNFFLWFRPETLRPWKLLANYLCYLLVFLLLYALCRSVFFSTAIGGTLFLLFGIANYFTGLFRGSPILPWDLTTVGTAADVLEGYEFRITGRMALFVFLFVCYLCFLFSLCGARPLPAGKLWVISERGASLVVTAALAVLLFPCNILTHMEIVVFPWNQLSSMQISGVMTGFYANTQFLRVEKPSGYSAEAAAELAQRGYPQAGPLGAPEKDPVIITVMNESFVDFTQVGELECSEDPMPFLHSLEASGEVVWGSAYASVYGGGTCNSEYEFLTGNTTAFLPVGSRPYQQYVKSEQPSLAGYLKTLGYDTVAVHPGKRGAWQRDTAYPNLGFDEFVDADSFHTERNLVRSFTDDRTNYGEVIWQYEHRDKSRNLFLLNVTIQNHGGYDIAGLETRVRIQDCPGKYPQAEQYLTLVRESDKALEELVSYFSKEEQPVVLLFFGDHWPKLEEEFCDFLLGTGEEGRSFEDTMDMYQVPFVIWANYPLRGEEIQGTSLNYLSGLLTRAAGLPCTGYQNYLEALRQEVPAITALGFSNGNRLMETGEEGPWSETLREYAVLEYNHIFGGEERIGGFFLPEKEK